MEYRLLGHSDLEVSAFSLGSWLTYEFMEEKEALAVIEKGLEAGINFLDDARYDDRTGQAPMKSGFSEVVFGRLLRQGGWNRDELVIANKLWYQFYPEEIPEAEVDGSLSRLQMEYLDLVYCVSPPEGLPVAEMVQQMDDLIKKGKIRHWGILNWPPAQIEAAWQVAEEQGLAAPCAAQLAYNLVQKSPVEEEPTRVLIEAADIGVVASYTLYGGLLTGKYNQAGAETKGRFNAAAVESMRQKNLLPKVDSLINLAQEMECTPAQLAMAYCLANDQVVSLLFGATKVSQVNENLQALDILSRLDTAVMEKLHALF